MTTESTELETLAHGRRDADAIISVAKEAAEAARPFAAEPGAVYLTPYQEEDGTRRLDIEDLEHLLDEPRRLHGEYDVEDVASFVEFAEQRLDVDRTTIWISDDGSAVAVLNDASVAGEAGWRDHRVLLRLQHTEEWRFWLGKDGHALSQSELAEHIEDGMPEIVKPDGASLHEMVQDFHAASEGKFRQKVDLSSGSIEATYDHVVDGETVSQGEKITFPREFELQVSPFVGEELATVVARLRYRVVEGSLRLSYHLVRPKQVERDAINRVQTQLAEKFEGRVYRGTPAL